MESIKSDNTEHMPVQELPSHDHDLKQNSLEATLPAANPGVRPTPTTAASPGIPDNAVTIHNAVLFICLAISIYLAYPPRYCALRDLGRITTAVLWVCPLSLYISFMLREVAFPQYTIKEGGWRWFLVAGMEGLLRLAIWCLGQGWLGTMNELCCDLVETGTWSLPWR